MESTAVEIGACLSVCDRVAIPVIRRVESLISPPVGQSVLVVAHRVDDA